MITFFFFCEYQSTLETVGLSNMDFLFIFQNPRHSYFRKLFSDVLGKCG